MSEEVVNGYYKLKKHCFVDFEFLGLTKTELGGFNRQNAVVALEFRRESDSKYCNIVSTYGVDGYLEAKTIKVKAVEPILEEKDGLPPL